MSIPLSIGALRVSGMLDDFMACLIIFHFMFQNSSISIKDTSGNLVNLRTVDWKASQDSLLHMFLYRTQSDQPYPLFLSTLNGFLLFLSSSIKTPKLFLPCNVQYILLVSLIHWFNSCVVYPMSGISPLVNINNILLYI